jgi:hypothetical protein
MLIDPPLSTLSSQPYPGEIWELDGSWAEDIDQENRDARRYVLIVQEPQVLRPQVLSVMLLSVATQYISSIDLLIPASISGLDQDTLAETWNVGSLSLEYLGRRVGQRLSHQIYDLLLSIGDFHYGLLTSAPNYESIQALGLAVASERSAFDRAAIDDFHQREKIWLKSLDSTLITHVNNLVKEAIQTEQELIQSAQIPTSLSAWFQENSMSQWQTGSSFMPRELIALRQSISTNEITDTIAQLESINDEGIRRQLIQKLGAIATGRNDILQTLVELVSTTKDDETLWIAVDSLRQIEPNHPATGLQKFKVIDLGITVELVVSIIQKMNDQMGVLLQVYHNSAEPYLPTNLKLILQDQSGNNLKEVVARSSDYGIQLKFSGEPGELFSICLELDGVQSIEAFIL